MINRCIGLIFVFCSGIKRQLFYLNESAHRLNALWKMIAKRCVKVQQFVLRYVRAQVCDCYTRHTQFSVFKLRTR